MKNINTPDAVTNIYSINHYNYMYNKHFKPIFP